MLGLCGLLSAFCQGAWSQDLPSATQPSPATPGAGSPSVPSQPEAISAEQLEKRLKAMEEVNKKLAEQLEKTNREHGEQMNLLLEKLKELSNRVDKRKDGAVRMADDVSVPTSPRAVDRAVEPGPPLPRVESQPIGPGPSLPVFQPPTRTDQGNDLEGAVPEYETQPIEPNPFLPEFRRPIVAGPAKTPLNTYFGPGFQYLSEDEEFLLQIHIQSQVEARVWGRSNQSPVSDGFFLPRQRIFFNGRITRSIEYVFSINRGFGDLNILETFINYHPSDKFQVRFGRYFTPLGYDQFAIRNIWLPTPERSLFTTNLGLNRQVGLMAWGFLFDKRLDYAAGVFGGPRNSFEDFNNSKDFVGYLNARPFQESESLWFARFLNIGSSVAFGYQDQPAVPLAFRVAAVAPTNSPAAGIAAAPFLTLNPNVAERGDRLLGSVHAAYYFKSLSLIGEWQYGHESYASSDRRTPTRVPVSGFYLTGGYFLTGEQVERRAMVHPLRPFIPTGKGERKGPGAWELVGRVSELHLGEQVFTAGLADRNRWSNQAVTTELGANWYWNEYAKIYMFWLHADFGDPVQYRPGGFQKAADLFWMRFQLYF